MLPNWRSNATHMEERMEERMGTMNEEPWDHLSKACTHNNHVGQLAGFTNGRHVKTFIGGGRRDDEDSNGGARACGLPNHGRTIGAIPIPQIC